MSGVDPRARFCSLGLYCKQLASPEGRPAIQDTSNGRPRAESYEVPAKVPYRRHTGGPFRRRGSCGYSLDHSSRRRSASTSDCVPTEESMKFKLLECVVLRREMPEHYLRTGDVGTVVETYGPDGLEVEFMSASGDTQAVLTLSEDDVRAADSNDMLSVRPLRRSSA